MQLNVITPTINAIKATDVFSSLLDIRACSTIKLNKSKRSIILSAHFPKLHQKENGKEK
jgi:hypothetical protein